MTRNPPFVAITRPALPAGYEWRAAAKQAYAAWNSGSGTELGKMLRAMEDPEYARECYPQFAVLHTAPAMHQTRCTAKPGEKYLIVSFNYDDLYIFHAETKELIRQVASSDSDCRDFRNGKTKLPAGATARFGMAANNLGIWSTK